MKRAVDEDVPPGGEPLGDFRWDPWTPSEVAARLVDVPAPWGIASGWAIDLFRGVQTREHRDIDVVVPAASFGEILEALRPQEFVIVGKGRRWPVADAGALAALHQTWLRDPSTGAYKLDVFREPHDGETWICRRDPSVRLPYGEVIRRSRDGIPYVAPEIVLLFKAKAPKSKDEHDFKGALLLLDRRSRQWLRGMIQKQFPGHPWLAEIEA